VVRSNLTAPLESFIAKGVAGIRSEPGCNRRIVPFLDSWRSNFVKRSSSTCCLAMRLECEFVLVLLCPLVFL
jgi:hypothetical protein